MNFFLSLLLTIATIPNYSQEIKADDITYEWLVKESTVNSYTNHVQVFKKIFNNVRVKNFLEFGLGYSTKYFLDNSTKVISVEFITNGCGPDWVKKYINLYQESYNWIPIMFFSGFTQDTSWATYKYVGSDAVYKAGSYQCSNHKNYALIDDFYLLELNAFLNNLSKTRPLDVAFVDPSLYLRGDLVQLLFDKAPIIVAHDSVSRARGIENDVYGYSRIKTPEHYEEIFVPIGSGTTVWIIKNEKYTNLIQEIKDDAQSH